MRLLSTLALLAICGTAVALPQLSEQAPEPASATASTASALASESAVPSALPVQDFDTPKFARPLSLDEALAGVNATVTTIHDNIEEIKKKLPKIQLSSRDALPETAEDLEIELEHFEKRQSQCSNVRVRTEWDSYPDSSRQAFIDAIRCLMNRAPSGQFGQSRSRYEDFVALHQTLTPRVHGNAKFLLWHRYYLWTFEDVLRRDCGLGPAIPWFDETKYAGRYPQSSIFSSRWFGSVDVGGNCVTNGQFANIALNVGPGSGNTRHCLSRNNNDERTANTNQAIVDACNGRNGYADMASCAEGGAHAWGHNGIGAVMQDTFAAPADPVFWLHHAFIDRNFRIWQNANPGVRTTSISGTNADGQQLSLDERVNVYGFRPDVRIRDILDTRGPTLCYKYNY